MEDRITVAAVGDIFMGRHVEDTINRKGVSYVFDRVRSLLRGHDVVVGNLESPVSDMEVTNTTVGRLIAKPISLDGLKEAGFNAVSLANNHIMDFGPPALQNTLCELKKREIGSAGAGLNEVDARQPLGRIGGKSITLLAYYGLGKSRDSVWPYPHPTCDGALGEKGGHNSGEIAKVLEDIGNARREADIVMVAVHWPVAALSLPMKHQVELARHMIDRGASVVLGSGPHVLQPVEHYKGGVIAYSLGNFVFDQEKRENQKHSMILHLSFVSDKIDAIKITPIQISSEHRPEPIEPSANPMLYKSIQSLLVHQLDGFASDAQVLSNIHLGDLTLERVLRKIIRSDSGVYPLSFYMRGLVELVKERWLLKSN